MSSVSFSTPPGIIEHTLCTSSEQKLNKCTAVPVPSLPTFHRKDNPVLIQTSS